MQVVTDSNIFHGSNYLSENVNKGSEPWLGHYRPRQRQSMTKYISSSDTSFSLWIQLPLGYKSSISQIQLQESLHDLSFIPALSCSHKVWSMTRKRTYTNMLLSVENYCMELKPEERAPLAEYHDSHKYFTSFLLFRILQIQKDAAKKRTRLQDLQTKRLYHEEDEMTPFGTNDPFGVKYSIIILWLSCEVPKFKICDSAFTLCNILLIEFLWQQRVWTKEVCSSCTS